MRNYTEELKEYWQSKDFSFIATLKKINPNTGFFNHFINPVNSMQLYYPEFDEIEVLDKRVSFYFGEANKLDDGMYYKIVLEYNVNADPRNNPYSLSIKSFSELNQDKVNQLIEKGKTKERSTVKYFGKYNKTRDNFACFKNVMVAETGEILLSNRESLDVFVSPKVDLLEGDYYSFSIINHSDKLPSAILNTIERLKTNPYQKHIQQNFDKRTRDPESNKMIANLMLEISRGMYSSKQRMIFELLQNADDAPGKDKVEFHIDAKGDYLFIMHDGAPFSKQDVNAITSAAQSTKRNDKEKTGYKGIGFKSVFTGNTEVWLKSRGYQFAFIRKSSFYESFDNFYFSSNRYKNNPKYVEEDKQLFAEQRSGFNSLDDIPWQIIPIWQDELPSEFNDSNFNNFNNPVQFALKFGANNINSKDGFLNAIKNIVSKPHFLLFLRNTSKFRSPKNGVTVKRSDYGNIIKIEKSTVDYFDAGKTLKREEVLEYTKHVYSDIAVSNEAFTELNIGIKKIVENKDLDQETYIFVDLDENKIENIPPKLATASETEIAFGISIKDNKIAPEKQYIDALPKYSSLFTYLPMEDTRFQLPFLVNANFVPSSDRQKIQGDNLWNKYIMIKVAEKHVQTLAHYAQEFINDNLFNSSYISLFLKNLLLEDDTAQEIIDSYNDTYLSQLKEFQVIVNDQNKTQLISDTILDDSGLSELFGNDIFYEIIDTDKRLPHPNLETSYLKDYDYLEVERIDLEQLSEEFTPEICDIIGGEIEKKGLYSNPQLLKWLNKLVEFIPDNFGKIPFILHNDILCTLNDLISADDAWLINKNTEKYEDILKGLEYHTVNLNLKEYPNINTFILNIVGYINDKSLAYERIANNSNLTSLEVSLKVKLIDFLQNSDFMIGIGEKKYFGELKLFTDENGIARPLRKLLTREKTIDAETTHSFKIIENEFNVLPEVLKNQLISNNDLFTSFILNYDLFIEWTAQFNGDNIHGYVSDLKNSYAFVKNSDEISSAQWISIPWLYIDNDDRFITADKVYWSNAFNKTTQENYNTIKSVLHSSELKKLPIHTCGEINEKFKLKTDNDIDIDWTKIKEIEKIPANILLDWMEDDGGFGSFFINHTFKLSENKHYSIVEIEDIHTYDGSNKELATYIQSNKELSSIFNELDNSLCSENRSKIGLLQGDKLLNAIINSSKYDQKLALYLPSIIPFELLQKFITNLKEFKLQTETEYDNKSAEHIIIYQLLKNVDSTSNIPTDLHNTIENLRGKITINDNPLSNYNISDYVSFGSKENRKVLRLSDVLTEFQGDTDELENVKESFSGITHKEKLRNLIFKTRQLYPEEIHTKIENEANQYYSVHQVVYQLLDKAYNGERKWSKKHFGDYYKELDDSERLTQSYELFLDVINDIEFTDLSDFTFYNLKIEDCVDKNYALKSEIIPEWLEMWMYKDLSKRSEFITKLGFNDINSPVIKLRKMLISEDYDSDEAITLVNNAKNVITPLFNTIEWLSMRKSDDYTTRGVDVTLKILSSNGTLANNTKYIPVINSFSEKLEAKYHLHKVNDETSLYSIDIKEETSKLVFDILSSVDGVYFTNKEFIQIPSKFIVKQLSIDSSLLKIIFSEKSANYENYKSTELGLNNLIIKNYALDSECIPEWLESWVMQDPSKRLKLLTHLGFNGIESSIVKLRKSMIAEEYEGTSVIKHFEDSKSNMQTIWSSVIWLSKYSQKFVTQNISVIRLINDFVKLDSTLKSITIPTIVSISEDGAREYSLQTLEVNSELQLLNSKLEFEYQTFNVLSKNNTSLVFIDENIGNLSSSFNIETIVLSEEIDVELLEKESTRWNELFYEKWENYSKYLIYIYNGGEIPYLRTFKGTTINKFTKDLKVSYNGGYYVSNILKSNVPDSLPTDFPEEILSNLEKWQLRTYQDESLLEDDPFKEKYTEEFDRMIQDRFGIDPEKQNDENNDARKQALFFLDGEGYNIHTGNCNDSYSAFYNLHDPSGNPVNIIVRSAKGGLLFLDKEHWEMLNDEKFQLVVIYPGSSPRLFKERLELLEEELVKKVIFRIPNRKNEKDIDNIFRELPNDSHVLLVTGEKMKKSLFADLGENGRFKKEEDYAVAGDDFKL